MSNIALHKLIKLHKQIKYMKNKNEIAVFSLSGIDAILWPPNYLMDRNSRVREERQKVYPNIAITSLHEKIIDTNLLKFVGHIYIL